MQQLSDAEKEVMEIIWKTGGKTTFAPLMEAARAAGKTWQQNTVLTFLVRLSEKGYLSAVKTGRTKEYTATLSREEYQEQQAELFLHKVYGGNAKGLVTTLLKHEGMTEEDIRQLQEFWDKGGDGD